MRVPRAFLERINIPAFFTTNYQSQQLVLTDEFQTVFRVTTNEAAQAAAALNEAQHEYLMARGRHLIPTEAQPPDPWAMPNRPGRPARPNRVRPQTLEKQNFVLQEFPTEARAIRENLLRRLRSILGPDRLKYFLWFGERQLESSMNTFPPPKPAPGLRQESSMVFYSFMLRGSEPRPMVALDIIEPGRAVGNEYLPDQDRYAPAAFQPTLAKWRERLADLLTALPASPPVKTRPEFLWDSQGVPAVRPGDPPWDETAPFVELPKRVIPGLQVYVLTVGEQLTDDACVLLGIRDGERAGINALYLESKRRFQELQRQNFEQTSREPYRFRIRPFPEAAEQLQRERVRQLGEIVGLERSRYLEVMIRRTEVHSWHGSDEDTERQRINLNPRWLEGGKQEWVCEITRGNMGWQVQFRGEVQGSRRSSKLMLSEPWIDLITPAMVGVEQILRD